jgi:Gluconate 2-dehydrogenase subunit 3
VTTPPLSRREVLRLAALSALGSTLGRPASAWAPVAQADDWEPRFFTGTELRIVDALTERVIPADAHSPGAREAQVARFIDAMLGEADPAYPEDAELLESWRGGLEAARAANRELHSGEILEGTPEQHDALLGRLSSEAQESSPEGAFFSLLKEWTVFAYYTSEIGIHRELGYQGNTVQEEFTGALPSGPARSGPGA